LPPAKAHPPLVRVDPIAIHQRRNAAGVGGERGVGVDDRMLPVMYSIPSITRLAWLAT
jgi:hypothetical protein